MWKHYQPLFPESKYYDYYVEPFLGGGAIYGSYGYHFTTSVLNDANHEIVGIYIELRDNLEQFIDNVRYLVTHYFSIPVDKESRKSYYYDLRTQYWENPHPALLYVLMKLGFNGIWQTCKDSHGLFGTPAGLLNHTEPNQVFNPQLFSQWSAELERTLIQSVDYSQVKVRDNSFIFCDPPYRDSFTTYSTGFDDDEQRRLIMWMRRQVESGNTVAFSNRTVPDDKFFEDLCSDMFDFHYFPVTYTAGRRRKTEDGYEAKPAIEFLARSR